MHLVQQPGYGQYHWWYSGRYCGGCQGLHWAHFGTSIGEEVVEAAASIGDIVEQFTVLAVGESVGMLVGAGAAISVDVGPAFGVAVRADIGEDDGTMVGESFGAAVGALWLAVYVIGASADILGTAVKEGVVQTDVGEAVVVNPIIIKEG